MRRLLCTAVLATCVPVAPASAQQLSRVSLDSVGAMDLFRGDGTSGNPGASLDISSVIRIGRGWSAHIRPWFFKSSANGSLWNREIYQAAVRYERASRVSTRLDAGFIASPIGLGMLDMRADINPTIQSHPGYFMPLARFDGEAPALRTIASSYPLGANLTVSTTKWDVRGAVVNSAPTRKYALNNRAGNPDATPVLIAGGGVTPIPGLRVGTSYASGRYATAAELRQPLGPERDLRMWTAEAEYAFGYTKLSTELVQARFAHGAARETATSWFLQGTHTLTPRWYVAGRHESVRTPPSAAAGTGAPRLSFHATETSAGYRLTPELTLRASVLAARGFTASGRDWRVGLQAVWSRRWW